LTIYAGEPDEFARTLKDYQAYDANYRPLRRRVRGVEVTVYRLPAGLGLIDKRRGLNAWTCALWVDRQLTSDMISMLGRFDPLYVAIHEMKVERRRWALSVALQTTNPAEE
jgi:hypothetical protein